MKSYLPLYIIIIQITFSRKNLLNQPKIKQTYKSLDDCIEKNCTNKKIDNLTCLQKCLLLQKKNSEQKKTKKKEILKKIEELNTYPENYCLNGKEYLKMTKKETLLEFAKGPCSPLMLVPGVLATKLVIEIDCEELQKNDEELFNQCGWNTCEKEGIQKLKFWKSVPEKEYNLWIPNLNSPLNIFSIDEKSNLCFSKLFKPVIAFERNNLKDSKIKKEDGDFSHYDENLVLNKKRENLLSKKNGVTIKIFGFSENTKKDNECGDGALRDLLPIPIQNDESAGFSNLIKSIKRIGYTPGLTYQSMPYNFYLSYKKNEFQKNFAKNLERLNKITKKKVSIIAHSMGNINVLYNLNLLEKNFLKKTVYNYLAIAPPFLGSYLANKIIFSGNDSYITLGNKLGFHFNAAVEMSSSQPSVYELSIVDGFKLYKNEKWFENILKRIKYENSFKGKDQKNNKKFGFFKDFNKLINFDLENSKKSVVGGNISFEDSGISFWPKMNDICHETKLNKIPKNCFSGLFTTSEKFIKIGEDSYSINEIDELNKKYNLNEIIYPMYKKFHTEEIAKLFPKVPTAILFMNSNLTTKKLEYKNNYYDLIKNNQFPEILNPEYTFGDQTVPSFSSILPGLRWAFKYEKNKVNDNYYPVKFIEYCSSFNTNKNIYDGENIEDNNMESKDVNEENKQIKNNGYMGIKCKCMGQNLGEYKECKHSTIHSDPNVIRFIYDFILANQLVEKNELDKIKELDEEELNEEVSNCSHMISSIFN